MTDDEKARRLEEAYAAVNAARAKRDAAAAEVERLANAGPDDELDADLKEIASKDGSPGTPILPSETRPMCSRPLRSRRRFDAQGNGQKAAAA
jgi:hypothetical protein